MEASKKQLESRKTKSKQQIIKENKPKREKKIEQEIQFRKNLQILIRLRQHNQFIIETNEKLKKAIQKKQYFIEDEEQIIELQKISSDLDMMKKIVRQKGIEFTQLRRPSRQLWVDNSLQHFFGILRLTIPTAQSINQPTEVIRRESLPIINASFEELIYDIEHDDHSNSSQQASEFENKEEN